MKCLKKGDVIIKVQEKDVDAHLRQGYSFTNKSEYKNAHGKGPDYTPKRR